MNFKEALRVMKTGIAVKLPSWEGYWRWNVDLEKEEETIMMHCRDGSIVDIRDTYSLEYTLENILSDEWMAVKTTEDLKPVMTFGDALKYLDRGLKVRRRGWNGKGIFIELQKPDAHSKMTHPYIFIDTTGLNTDNPDAPRNRVPWFASQTDMLAKDWEIVND